MSVRRRVQRYKGGQTSTRWFVDIKFRHADGSIERVRKVPRVQSRVGAERLERELMIMLEQRLPPTKKVETPVKVATLAEFWPRFYSTHVLPNNKPSEQWTKTRIMKGHLLPAFGALTLEEVTTGHVDDYKARLVRLGYKSKTINNHLTVLRTLLRTAVQWRLIAEAPTVKLLRVPRQEVVFLDFDEAEAAVAAAEGQIRAMMVFALNTGLRVGELLALRWEDVSIPERRVRVSQNDWQGHVGTPKGGQAREVPLNGRALGVIQALRTDGAGLVFRGADGGPYRYRSAQLAIEKVSRRVGEKRFGWHALRHTFASHLVMRGVSLTAVQQLLGHSTQAMTERYAHLTPGVRREAVEVLD